MDPNELTDGLKSKDEKLSRIRLRAGLSDGSIVALKNADRSIKPVFVGAGTKTKVNANVGFSPRKKDLDLEIHKAETAVEYGADAVMDLSIGHGIDEMRRKLLKDVPVPLGTVPVYQAFLKDKVDMTLDSILGVIERQARDGVDFMTLHCGITQELVEKSRKRLIPITSRGGCFMAAWMIHNRMENPLYTGFDRIVDVAKEYDVVLSLGDALRPGTVLDASDYCMNQELRNLGQLTKKAREKGVQVIIEGPGHMPLNTIVENVRLEKKLCGNAPYYVLGPLVTDIALGYDHITGAIGGAIAAAHGADFLCYVTPSEHLGLPDIEDVKNGVIASKIAAHAADLVKYGNYSRDKAMSEARRNLDWDTMFKEGLKGDAREKYGEHTKEDVCSMCGEYCALKIMQD